MTTVTVEDTRMNWRPQATADSVQIDQEPRENAWFASLYNETYDTVYHLARVLVRDHDTAENIVAEAYLKAWRARLGFSGRGSQLSWVMAITRNCAMDHLRAPIIRQAARANGCLSRAARSDPPMFTNVIH